MSGCQCVPISCIVNTMEIKIFPSYHVNSKNLILKLNIERGKIGKKSHRMTDTSKLKDLLQKYNNQGSVLLLRGDN